jgi:hypothetical protein
LDQTISVIAWRDYGSKRQLFICLLQAIAPGRAISGHTCHARIDTPRRTGPQSGKTECLEEAVMSRTPIRTASRLALAVSALALAGTSVSAQELQGSPLMDELLACRALASDSERLACMDQAASALDSAISAGELTVVERQRAVAAERNTFGRAVAGTGRIFGSLFSSGGTELSVEHAYEDGAIAERTEDGDIQALRGVPVRAIRADPFGKLVITLADGQVWRQTDSRRIAVPRDTEGLTVEIERGALTSFFMRLSSHPTRFRAARD